MHIETVHLQVLTAALHKAALYHIDEVSLAPATATVACIANINAMFQPSLENYVADLVFRRPNMTLTLNNIKLDEINRVFWHFYVPKETRYLKKKS